ncbi:DHHW family protein [Sedimentibacter sp.]|uniref:DHHW family protein n=1 Tax=Sedimentibacter sp. TaxID=1960295 RepID=UPI0028A2D4C8|nr:DHHW family protein [Sedimentibacter sp.]
MRKNNKRSCIILQNIISVFPFLFIYAVLILYVALPDKTFSKEEQRYLAQWPDFYVENVLNGSYENKVESYFSDQFPFRNFWIHIYEVSNQTS